MITLRTIDNMAKKFPKYKSSKDKKRKFTDVSAPNSKSKLYNPKPSDDKPSISLKYIDLGYKTFEDLGRGSNLKHFDNFVKEVSKSDDWEPILRLRNKKFSDQNKKKIKNKRKYLEQRSNLDFEQTEIFHIRLSKKFRVHGFIYENRFKLIWLDPDHEIDKMH